MLSSTCPHRQALRDDPEPSCGPDPVCSMWITSETGTVHYGCAASVERGQEMIVRFVAAGVAIKGELGACCHEVEMACCFDVMGDDQLDDVVLLSYALSRAEGRSINPPYRCGCCGHMTYGGCCG